MRNLAFESPSVQQLLIAVILALPLAYFLTTFKKKSLPSEDLEPYRQKTMAAPNPSGLTSPPVHLNAPKLDLYTQAQLKAYDGTTPGLPIYVAIKGQSP